MKFRIAAALASAVVGSIAVAAVAQITAPPALVPAGIAVDTIKVHGASLVGNLEGNSPDRTALVVLPPSYAKAKGRRYPVIYFLHGFMIDAQNFLNYLHVPEAVAHSASKGAEFIVVVPDSDTRQGGSMYSNSPTTGDFQGFIAKDLVDYVDHHYRTIAARAGRGLAGHSMGGYGTWRIGMAYPQAFSSLYAMSGCCISLRGETPESARKLSSVAFDAAAKADFGTRAGLASAVAWSPAPDKPPYYASFPYKDGAVDQAVLAQWAANSPLALVAGHVPQLKSFAAIGADVGTKDFLLADDTAIHDELNRFGIAHQWATYDGDHVDHIAERFDQVVLPFFAKHLSMK